MTTHAASQRFIAMLAGVVAEVRASLGHSTWDEPGIAAAIRHTAEHTPMLELAIAFLRAAGDPANDTPAAIQHANNRAWDTDWYLPCKLHPETRARRLNGECASCWTDRNAASEALPLRNRGVPPAPDVRRQLAAAFTASDRATASEATSTETTSAEVVL
jgi:hypothetical protein